MKMALRILFWMIQISKIKFKYNRAELPTTFHDFFIKASDVHHYATRSNYKQTYYIPKFKLVKFQKSLVFRWKSMERYSPEEKSIYFPNFKKFTKIKFLKITRFKIKART